MAALRVARKELSQVGPSASSTGWTWALENGVRVSSQDSVSPAPDSTVPLTLGTQLSLNPGHLQAAAFPLPHPGPPHFPSAPQSSGLASI